MKSTTFALVASFLCLVSASPLNFERDIEYKVVTDVQVATAYATVFATEGEAAPTTSPAAAVAPVAVTTTVAKGKGRTRTWNWHQDTTTSTSSTSSTSSTTPPPPPPTTTSTTEAPAPPTVVPTTTSPTSVAPVFTTPQIIPTVAATTAWAAPAAATTAAAPAVTTGDDSYDAANLEAGIQSSTNSWRAKFQAAPLAWNQSLVDMAVASVQSCDFEHSNAGQNLAAGYAGPGVAVDGWAGEYTSFDFSKPDWNQDAGHFTQLVWQDSTTQGCAAKNCPTDGSTPARGWYLICNYFPVGNMLGEFPQNIKSEV